MALRDVEVIVQQRLSLPDTEVSKSERETLLKIQAILYSTEVSARQMHRRFGQLIPALTFRFNQEGFEAPPADELALDEEDKFEHEQLEGGVQQLHLGEQLNMSRGSHAGVEHEGQLLQEEETF
ncbi:hypothetical protein QFC24_002755 [Naganishia onofrii]|uniref:Uncharacterized protein n=1 Tax=Naganishia onofrii TaxID=1851511 RepID=A0ACC2XRH3_9TREE|nr:hypothetical protein QFC24_002755 [Naganishia onofrii]